MLKRLFSFIAVLFVGIMIIGSFPSPSSACSCAGKPTVGEELGYSKAVFTGKVVAVKEKRNLKGMLFKSVLFEVTNTWKGVSKSQIIITTGMSDGECGYPFTVGEKYLVYGSESDFYGKNLLETVICDRTTELSGAREDLQVLGKGKPPVEKVDLNWEFNGYSTYLWTGGGAILLVGAVGTIIIKKRKK